MAFFLLNYSKPSRPEIAANVKFEKYLDKIEPLATDGEVELRVSILSDIQRIVNKWVQEVSVKQGFSGEALRTACGKIFTFGSYRLGLITPSSDIDALCVTPKHISREDFFQSLLPILEANANVTDLSGVPDAVVPIIKLKYKNTEVDLTFARLNLGIIDSKLENLENNNLLKHLDEKTVRSINGTRVADALLALVPNQPTYRTVLRFVRHWAKKRGLYSNAMGFFGGITWAILSGRVCQMFPNFSPLQICLKFFLVYSRWNWGNPVILCPITQSTEVGLMGFKIWNPKLNHSDRSHLMPIVTPAFPCMNSTYNVSETTKRILISEFARAFQILSSFTDSTTLEKLVRPPPFLSLFRFYLAVDVCGQNPAAVNKLKGFVESRLRILLKFLENTPGVSWVRPWPGDFAVSEFSDNRSIWLVGLSFPNAAVCDLRQSLAQFHEKLADWTDRDLFQSGIDYSVRLFHVGVDNPLIRGLEAGDLKNQKVADHLKSLIADQGESAGSTLDDGKRRKIEVVLEGHIGE